MSELHALHSCRHVRPLLPYKPVPYGRQQSNGPPTSVLHSPSKRQRQSKRRRLRVVPGSSHGEALHSTSLGLAPELKQAVEDFLQKHKVVLFMKGTRQFPQCGFSNTCVQILNMTGVPYETVNILEDESLRQGMKEFSQWPTFPQVYINSEFVGGCDIMIETFQSGELKEMLEVAVNS